MSTVAEKHASYEKIVEINGFSFMYRRYWDTQFFYGLYPRSGEVDYIRMHNPPGIICACGGDTFQIRFVGSTILGRCTKCGSEDLIRALPCY